MAVDPATIKAVAKVAVSVLTNKETRSNLLYIIVELAAPYGYVLDSTPVYFDIAADNSEIAEGITVVKTEKKNAPQKSVINIYKSGEIFSSVIVKDDKYTPCLCRGRAFRSVLQERTATIGFLRPMLTAKSLLRDCDSANTP